MHHLSAFSAIALSLVASVSSLAVPRATPPKGWNTALLENYDTYHTRYMALSCNAKHDSAFFNQCCHPLLKTQSINSLPAQCNPNAASKPTPSAAPAPVAVTTPAPKKVTSTPKPAPTPSPNSGATVQTGGFATFFYQNGVAGACGTVHPDSALIAAIDGQRYGNLGAKSQLCGQQVKITNTKNNKSVTVTIADACPTCVNSNSIDLSTGAFQQIATLDEGMVPITWSFV
jgi:hypothetical protein